MANIGFTDKQIHVYHRFNTLRRAYEDANGGGRVYNPDFLAVLMDAWFKQEENRLIEKIKQADNDLEISLRAYIADAEANDPELQPKRKSFGEKRRLRNERLNSQPVRIKDSDNRYISDVGIATANFDITSYKDESMVFDSHDEAKAFLRKYGRDVEDWILEPENETEWNNYFLLQSFFCLAATKNRKTRSRNMDFAKEWL